MNIGRHISSYYYQEQVKGLHGNTWVDEFYNARPNQSANTRLTETDLCYFFGVKFASVLFECSFASLSKISCFRVLHPFKSLF